ncbi:MAG: hypothetical protein AAB731_05000 [Patescibacteria group bacterium]
MLEGNAVPTPRAWVFEDRIDEDIRAIDRLEDRAEEVVSYRGDNYNRAKRRYETHGATMPPSGRRSRQDIHFLLNNTHRSVVRKKGWSIGHCCITKWEMRGGKKNGIRRRPESNRLATYRGETRHIITVTDSFGTRDFRT